MTRPGLELGDLAPDFVLADPEGRVFDSRVEAGNGPSLVLFLCNHCPYVKHIAQQVGRCASDWINSGTTLVGINSNAMTHPGDTPDKMQRFARQSGWTFPYVIDGAQVVAELFGALSTPDIFLFNRHRRLVYHGQFDSSRPKNDIPVTGSDIDAAVQSTLRGELPKGDQHPAVGCSIKWLSESEPGA